MRRAALALAVLAVAVPSAKAGPPPFVPIHLEHIALPAGYAASTPIWTTDGHHLLFSSGGELHLIGEDGSGLTCLTCGLPNDPHFAQAAQEAFKDVFPDGKRVMFGDFTKVFVLECEPTVLQCTHRALIPVDVSAGDQGGAEIDLGPGVWHLAPDGKHLGWTATRLDTRPMLIGTLVRRATEYAATDVRVLNPPGPASRTDTNPVGWTNAGALYELKGFTEGGRAIDYVTAQYQGNPDVYQVDLATGQRTRLTANPDWDEDNGMSPDGSLLLLHSDRGMHRVDADGLLPRRSFIDYPISLEAAIYYVGTNIGFQCDLQPWLLPGTGDDDGRLLGQPLDPYTGGDLHAQNNVPGRGAWSPDSTKVALTEMSYTTTLGSNRLLVAKLDRPPTKPTAVVDSDVGPWAQTPAQYRGVADSNTIVTVHGLAAGSATITYLGTVLEAGHYSVVYDHYSDDGKSFVDGTESIDAPSLNVLPATLRTNLTISGEHRGSLRSDLSIGRLLGKPYAQGTADTELDGYRLAGKVPKLGPCPSSLPTVQPLAAKVRVRRGAKHTVVRVTVTADSDPTARTTIGLGDTRPVARALVRIAGRRARTDERGRARLALPPRVTGRRRLIVTAGDTFTPATATVRLTAAPDTRAGTAAAPAGAPPAA
jgi:hypothetical protein